MHWIPQFKKTIKVNLQCLQISKAKKLKKMYFKAKINVIFEDSKSLEKLIVGQPITA